MKRTTIVVLLSLVLVGIGFAGNGGKAGPTQHAALNPVVLDSGAWGNVSYSLDEDSLSFVLNAHGLQPGTAYVLKSGGLTIAEATANKGGNLHMQGDYQGALGLRLNIRTAQGNVLVLQTAVIF